MEVDSRVSWPQPGGVSDKVALGEDYILGLLPHLNDKIRNLL